MTYMKAVEAGVDVIDTAMSPFALGTSSLQQRLWLRHSRAHSYDTGLDQNLLQRLLITSDRSVTRLLSSGLMNPKNSE